MASSHDLTLSVTESQYEAITFPLDPNRILKIIAGPGSGKTRTLVSKIAYSLSQGVVPSEILVLSLTNRAVFALKDQISELVGVELADQVNIQTFHSYAVSVVSLHYSNDWRILEDVGWRSLVNIASNSNTDKKAEKKPKRLTRHELEKIIKLANDGLSSEEISDSIKSRPPKAQIESVMNWIHHSNIVTYDDLLKTATKEIDKNQEIVTGVKTVIVDEFQDVYGDLLKFIKAIAKTKNLVIAGDPNQSIYGFLGSEPDLIYEFDKEFPDKEPTTITLNECFRSTPEIIRASDAIIQATEYREHFKDSGPMPIYSVFNSELEEYKFISTEIKKILDTSDGVVKPKDIVVLSRTNKKLEMLKRFFNKEDVRTVKLASVQTWVDSYIFHLVDYLQILYNPHNCDHSLISVVALLDNVGTVTVSNLMKEVGDRNASLLSLDEISLWDYLHSPRESNQNSDKLIRQFIVSMHEKKEIFDNVREDPEQLMKLLLSIADEFGLRKMIMKTFLNPEDSSRYQEHLKNFYDSLCNCFNTKPDDVPLVEYFLRHYNDVPTFQDEGLVNLSTIHAAKGLEFPICFVLAKEPSTFYHSLDVESERRSLYVAITRASVLLYYNALQDPFRTNENLISTADLSKYFTNKTPSFTPSFWSHYLTTLGLTVSGTRQYHTYSRRYIHSFTKRTALLRRFLIK